MNGEDHGKGKPTTVESEAYMLSEGRNQPMQYRLHQSNSYHKLINNYKKIQNENNLKLLRQKRIKLQ